MKPNNTDKFDQFKRAPLWKWLVIILLVTAMPLFFSFVRDSQIQQTLMNNAPTTQETLAPAPPKAQK